VLDEKKILGYFSTFVSVPVASVSYPDGVT